jgi:hypothetical protein
MLLQDTSHFTVLRIHALASYLGTLDAPREGHDVRVELEDDV